MPRRLKKADPVVRAALAGAPKHPAGIRIDDVPQARAALLRYRARVCQGQTLLTIDEAARGLDVSRSSLTALCYGDGRLGSLLRMALYRAELEHLGFG